MKTKKLVLLAACVCTVAVAVWLLAFGVLVLFGAPLRSGQGFWRPEKLFFGLGPISAGFVLMVAVFARWARLFDRRRNAYLGACALIIIVGLLDVALFHKLPRQEESRERLVWTPESGVFTWVPGQVTLPTGFTYAKESGIDTLMGSFHSADGRIIVWHDIGELAGEHGGMEDEETLTAGVAGKGWTQNLYRGKRRRETLLESLVPGQWMRAFLRRSRGWGSRSGDPIHRS